MSLGVLYGLSLLMLLRDKLLLEVVVGVVAHEGVVVARGAGLHAELRVGLLVLVCSLKLLQIDGLGVLREIVLIEGCTSVSFNELEASGRGQDLAI
jgi:hypothetical protein